VPGVVLLLTASHSLFPARRTVRGRPFTESCLGDLFSMYTLVRSVGECRFVEMLFTGNSSGESAST